MIINVFSSGACFHLDESDIKHTTNYRRKLDLLREMKRAAFRNQSLKIAV